MGKQKLYIENPTKRMQLRGKNEGEMFDIYICGIDIFEPKELQYSLVTTNLGIYGTGFREFLVNFIRYREGEDTMFDIYRICDDPAYDNNDDEIPSPEINGEHFDILFHKMSRDEQGRMFCEIQPLCHK